MSTYCNVDAKSPLNSRYPKFKRGGKKEARKYKNKNKNKATCRREINKKKNANVNSWQS